LHHIADAEAVIHRIATLRPAAVAPARRLYDAIGAEGPRAVLDALLADLTTSRASGAVH
jgi:hypothetical protein